MTSRGMLAAAALLAGLTLAAGEAAAISRYQSTSMSCPAIHAAIANEGAVILRWTQPPNIQRYDRYVYSSAQCYVGLSAVPTSVPSASGACTVNECKRCRPEDFFRGAC